MSRRGGHKRSGIALPLALRQELGIQDPRNHGQRRGPKKYDQNGGDERRRPRPEGQRKMSITKDIEDEQFIEDARGFENIKSSAVRLKPQNPHPGKVKQTPTIPSKSSTPSLRQSRARSSPDGFESQSGSDSERSSSPGIVLDASSKAFRDRSAQDDAEIALLEKRLGMRKKKSSSMGDDALDYLLNDIDDEEPGKKRKLEGSTWLQSKRMKRQQDQDDSETEEDSGLEGHDVFDGFTSQADTDNEDLGRHMSHKLGEQDSTTSDAHSLDSHDTEDEVIELDTGSVSDESSEKNDKRDDIIKTPRVRENPYVAPAQPGVSVQKYVPPSLRNRNADDEQSRVRLKRQLQGQINRLSEANIISILGEIENLYRTNSRQDMSSALIEILLSLFCNRSALQNTFIILHAAFVAAVYKVIGTDFGAEMLVRLVEMFDKQYVDVEGGKQSLNLISLLANLFTFNVVSSNIVYDYIRVMLSNFDEANAELLLRVVRDCGPQLRSDNPSALKGIVNMVQTVSSDMAKRGQHLNVRTKVMIDTIMDLKNNKMKNATNATGPVGEHITRMRKALGTLNNRSLKATEPLRLTKQDIEHSDKKGKWWLVGASWKGPDGHDEQVARAADLNPDDAEQASDGEIDYTVLAKQFKMNTDVRRSIFVAVMSANDIRDAQMRLLKLRLTNKQEQEIARVVLRCSRAEPLYNPYYALLAKSLCKDNKRIRMGFQFGLWAFFNALGEKADDGDSDGNGDTDQDVEMNEVVNLAKLYAYLIFQGQFSLGILKTLNIGMLREQATLFVEILLISIITQPKADEDSLMKVFGRTAETPQIIKSLQYFMRKYVQQSDLVGKADKAKVKEGCKIAQVAFTVITSSGMGRDLQ